MSRTRVLTRWVIFILGVFLLYRAKGALPDDVGRFISLSVSGALCLAASFFWIGVGVAIEMIGRRLIDQEVDMVIVALEKVELERSWRDDGRTYKLVSDVRSGVNGFMNTAVFELALARIERRRKYIAATAENTRCIKQAGERAAQILMGAK